MNAALFIGIETFSDPPIPPIKFAVNDANAVASAFGELGFPKEHGGQIILANEQATKGRIEYEIGRLLKEAREDDSVLIYISSHGANENGVSSVVCYDTILKGMPGTGFPIKAFFEMVKDTKSKRVILLLDCCHAGLQFPKGEKGLMGSMTNDDIKAFCDSANYCVAFASCASNETSRWSDRNHLGIWTSVLLDALCGKAKHILVNNQLLLAMNLQDYLYQQVPIRRWDEYKDKGPQTPQFYGSLSNNFIVANLESVLAKQIEGIGDLNHFLKGLSFRSSRTGKIKSLPGFGAKHSVPKTKTAATERFVEGIAEERVQDHARQLFDALMKAFSYAREEIQLDANGSSAAITTKDFEVDLSICQSADDHKMYLEVLTVRQFKSEAVIMSEPFNKVLFGEVDTLRVAFSPGRSVSGVIDQIQKATNSTIQIKTYEPDGSVCCIAIPGIEGEISLRANRTSIKQPSLRPRQMVAALTEARKSAMLDSATLLLLPTPPAHA